MKVDVYNTQGAKAGNAEIADMVFGAPFNADLVHQVVVSMQANARDAGPGAHTKDRSEVRGGGKKPWRQKGTGRARHGSIRSPIWVGGGVTHGPRKEKSYAKKINKKMRVKALYGVLSQKYLDQEIIFVDTLAIEEPKTHKAKAIIHALASVEGFTQLKGKKQNALLVVVPVLTPSLKKSFQNIGNVHLIETRNVNPVDLLTYKFVALVEPEASSDVFVARMEGEKRKAEKKETADTQEKAIKKDAQKKPVTKTKKVAKKTTKKVAPKKAKKVTK
jgi:large subunit ribosomal protein L4